MPLEQSEAIVLRSFTVGDQDKIVVFFSKDKGIIKGIAKGAQKFGSRFGSSLELMSVVKVFYYEKEGKDLVTASNCDLLESFFEMQKDLKTSFTLSYFSELIEEFSPTRAKDDILYRLLLSVLHALKEGGDVSFLARYFEVWLLKINGVLPDFRSCKKCRKPFPDRAWLSVKKDGIFCDTCATQKKEEIKPEIGSFVHWTKKNPPPERGPLPFSLEQLETIKKALSKLIIFHLEKEPKTLRYI